MAKRSLPSHSERTDPKKNKSLAIRQTLEKMPKAKATEIVAAVKKDFGHDIKQNMVYMIKTKLNMKGKKRKRATNASATAPVTALSSPAQWVEAIKIGRQLLEATGSVASATALLKALDR